MNLLSKRCLVTLSASLALSVHGAQAQEYSAPANAVLALRLEAQALEHGEGVRKDPTRAVQLYCEAARLGDADAQYSLGWIYANGRGVKRDDAMAAYFFELAEKLGHPYAKRMLDHVGEAAGEMPQCMRPPDVPETLAAVDGPDMDGKDLVNDASPAQRRMIDLVFRLAPEYGIYPRLALAVIRAESNFNPGAVSPKNAQGVMQLIPETSARFNVRKPFDPEQNIRGGLAYLRWLLAYFKGNVALVAAAYNAGEGTVNRFLGIPPYAETRGYVKRITELFLREDHPYDASITEPSTELDRIRVGKTSRKDK